jgi:predicted PurR-regulated permease PerM
MSESLDPSQIVQVLGDVLGSLASLSSSLFFLITVLLFMTFDAYGFPAKLEAARAGHPDIVDALIGFAHGTRTYLVVSTIFGFIVAVIDTAVLALIGVPAAAAWGVLAFVTNYIPNIGFVIGLIPPALLALLDGGPSEMVLVIVAYSAINFVIQSIIQPKFVADAVGLSPTLTILSLFFWAWALGAVGALLAIPLSLLVKALLVDSDRRAAWLRPLIGDSSTPPADAAAAQTATNGTPDQRDDALPGPDHLE